MPAEEEPAAMESRDADGSPQQFCLRWNNYQSNLANCFDQLLQTESFVDVTLACEGQSLKAHKVVLSACSPYFQTLFMDNPCRHPIIIMRDIKYCDLKAVVDFMYRGEINVSQDQITALLKVAETLKIRGLTDVSGEHAVLRPGGVEARAPKRPVSRDAESPAKARRRASTERSPGPSPRRSPSTPAGGAELVPPAETTAHVSPAMPPLHPDDVDIRPGIAEMIREEERKPFAKWVSHCVPNMVPRFFSSIFTWAPPFLIGILTYYYAEQRFHHLKRKNPEDYMWEVDPDPPMLCKRMIEERPQAKKDINFDDIVCPPPCTKPEPKPEKSTCFDDKTKS
ncbi:BTB/POZ domain-containing protein [Phthorimaea operculella]|nr:BTB/POZ domain-containing protein [Phthorimaea operculella]